MLHTRTYPEAMTILLLPGKPSISDHSTRCKMAPKKAPAAKVAKTSAKTSAKNSAKTVAPTGEAKAAKAVAPTSAPADGQQRNALW